MSCKVDVVGLRTLEAVVNARIARLQYAEGQPDPGTVPSRIDDMPVARQAYLEGGIDALKTLLSLLPDLKVEVERP